MLLLSVQLACADISGSELDAEFTQNSTRAAECAAQCRCNEGEDPEDSFGIDIPHNTYSYRRTTFYWPDVRLPAWSFAKAPCAEMCGSKPSIVYRILECREAQ